MRITVIILLLLLVPGAMLPAVAQKPGNWYSYYNAKTDLYGFKDAKGKIKIPARFNSSTHAWTFRNIIAVTDGRTNKSYYLLKNGKKVARDSLFVWDMSYDCEQEGKIRFYDPVTDKIGFLDQNGKVKIAAVYNDAQPFYNGLALVIYNGERICADGKPFNKDSCEHWSWNGTTALIDDSGRIVADSIDITKTENLNWYALKKTAQSADTALYTSFKAKNNGFYNFINYEKEFKNWFYQQFLINLNKKTLARYCFKEVTVEGLFKHVLRKNYTKASFLKQFGWVMQKKMTAVKQHNLETVIFSEGLNLFIYNSKKYETFYTDCGEPNTARFPLFDVVTSHYNKQNQFAYQEHFSFLRTASGYRLINVSLKNSR